MRRAALLAAAAAVLSACAHSRLAPGPYKEGYAVEVQAPSVEQARRLAVEQFFDLYCDTAAVPAGVLEEKVLGKAPSFIVREKAQPGKGTVTLRALVDYQRVERALDAAGLVRPEGVKGKPPVLVALRETAPGERAIGAGRASDTMRRRLIERGYSVFDDSDKLMGGLQKEGSREEALAHGKKLKADIVVTGTARGEAVADPRLSGYGNCKAVIAADAVQLPGEKTVAKVDQEDSSVDVGDAAACGKALESAGEIAADKVAAALGSLYRERVEFTVAVLNLGNLDRARQFLAAVRTLPRVANAALSDLNGSDARVKVWSDKMGADDMTAELLKLKEFHLEVREVEPAMNEIEFGTGEVY